MFMTMTTEYCICWCAFHGCGRMWVRAQF